MAYDNEEQTMDLKEAECDDVDLFHLARDRTQWRLLCAEFELQRRYCKQMKILPLRK
jgi:hypothetical protein